MYHVKLSIHENNVGCNRQIPHRGFIWKDFCFHINEEIEEADYWVVYSKGLTRKEKCKCSPDNTLFITGEPETTYHYSHGFISQFAKVLSVQDKIKHPNMVLGQPGLPWYLGKITERTENGDIVKFSCDYDSLSTSSPVKSKNLSLITSNKRFTKGHNDRIAFAMALKDHYGEQLDIYGNGFKSFLDKNEAISPYKYHICLENSSYPHYWSEKLADCFLAEAFPIYYGAPNVYDYFDESSLLKIDIKDIEKSIKSIDEAINNNYYEARLQSLRDAKAKVLNEYNLFEVIASNLAEMNPHAKKTDLIMKPDIAFFDLKKAKVMIIDRIINRLHH